MLDYFLILLLSHLLTDFVFQKDAMTEYKHEAGIKGHIALLLHPGIFFITSTVLFLITEGTQWFAWINLAILLLLSLSHYIVDFLKGKVMKRVGMGSDNQDIYRCPVWLFFADQLAHLILIVLFTLIALHNVIAWEFVPVSTVINIILPAIMPLTGIQKILIASSILIIITSFSNIVVKLSLKTTKIQKETSGEELITGRYIGSAERILTVVAIMAGAYEAVAILYASKTAIRFSQIQHSPEFREYYILGSMISALLGVLGGILAKTTILS